MDQFIRSDKPVRLTFQRAHPTPHQLDTRRHSFIVLLPNKWDDYGYSTMFYAYAVVRDTVLLIGRYRLLIEGTRDSAAFIEKRASDDVFQFLAKMDRKYLGLADGVDFYRRCRVIFQPHRIIDALSQLHDVSIMHAIQPSAPDLSLKRDEGFEQSLLRGSSERQALERGAAILGAGAEAESVKRFSLSMQLQGASLGHSLDFDFSEKVLPHDINVLIGVNGTGKTRALEALVDSLVNEGKVRGTKDQASLDPFPSFDQVIAISFSPYERFFRYPEDRNATRDTSEAALEQRALKAGYVYAGLRDARGRFRTSVSEARAIEALCLLVRAPETPLSDVEPDSRNTVIQVLSQAFHFDYIAVAARATDDKDEKTVDVLYEDDEWHRAAAGRVLRQGDNGKLIFRNNGERVFLSAGQKQFVHMALILMGRMRDNSLLIIDEPELYLHPALEVVIIRLLKNILWRFGSHAVIATHSSIILREVPSSCVSILKRANSDVVVRRPKIETFGADIAKIANEVFDDIFADAPYEQWLRTFAAGCGSFQAFKARADEEGLGNEAILYVRNSVFLKSER